MPNLRGTGPIIITDAADNEVARIENEDNFIKIFSLTGYQIQLTGVQSNNARRPSIVLKAGLPSMGAGYEQEDAEITVGGGGYIKGVIKVLENDIESCIIDSNSFQLKKDGKTSFFVNGNNAKIYFHDPDDPHGQREPQSIIDGLKGQIDINNIDIKGDSSELSFYKPGVQREIGRTILLDGKNGNLTLGGSTRTDGDLMILNRERKISIGLNGDSGRITLGSTAINNHGSIMLYDSKGKQSIFLDGDNGDIRIRNADLAEKFKKSVKYSLDPGTVAIFDDNGRVRPCNTCYDKRVAGIVSGANKVSAGLVLGEDFSSTSDEDILIAMSGTSYCKVDANFGSIDVGDLITTSSTSGYGMKLTDSSKALGTIVGKSIGKLNSGLGLVPVLIA